MTAFLEQRADRHSGPARGQIVFREAPSGRLVNCGGGGAGAVRGCGVAELQQGVDADGFLVLDGYQREPVGIPVTDLADLVQFVPGALPKQR